MSIANRNFIKVFRILLVSLLMMSIVPASHALMPKAGVSIGTRATIIYKDASDRTDAGK